MKADLVQIGEYYAVRRTSKFLGIFKTYEFLDLTVNSPQWKPRNWNGFCDCLTSSVEHAKQRLAFWGTDLGTPTDGNNVLSMQEYREMEQLATTDEGMKDLLMQAREFYLLKRK